MPRALIERIEDFIDANPSLGLRSAPEFLGWAARELLPVLEEREARAREVYRKGVLEPGGSRRDREIDAQFRQVVARDR